MKQNIIEAKERDVLTHENVLLRLKIKKSPKDRHEIAER